MYLIIFVTFRVRVSSVLNRDIQNYGKKHLIDGNDETCWNSEPSLPQWIRLHFSRKIRPENLLITFQGGFVGTACIIKVWHDSTESAITLRPVDNNSQQTFALSDLPACTNMDIQFTESSDLYGRIIIYGLDIQGNVE